MKAMKKYWKSAAALLLAICILYWGVAIIKCEVMTHRYGEQFADLYAQHTMFQTPDYHKVIKYTDTRAEIYYVNRGAGGDLVCYRREGPGSPWEFEKWVTVWSASGSADDFIWPYFR